jgi:anti-anti-sigma factor
MSPVSTEAFASPPRTTRPADFQLDVRGLSRATVQRHRDAVIVSVAGEVDASNVHAWAQLLTKTAATTRAPGPLVVDLRDLDFIGCCALAALARQTERCRRRGVRLCLVSRQQFVARAIAAAGLNRVLPIYPSTQTALLSRAGAGPVAS